MLEQLKALAWLLDSSIRRPGMLRRMTEHGMDIRHVEHRRSERHLPVGITAIVLQIMSRAAHADRAHRSIEVATRRPEWA
ncbi:MAG: hypothetical protein JNJ44_06865 [Zoogloeaceae bacterium]|nr:hypothetical protein [Zoogloeaceae bacterium]